jgi:hypothetical protein
MGTQIDTKNNYALSQVFGANLIKRLDDPAFEQDLKRLLSATGLISRRKRLEFSDALRITYRYLKANYRCEYVYKNEIANQLLLRFHNDNSATLLKEFGLNQSIADIVIVNGHTVAYEIKTELDNFERLNGQLDDYSQIFDQVYVVTHEAAVDTVRKLVDPRVGLVLLNKFGELITERTAINQEDVFNSEVAARALRQSELMSAYEKYEGALPKIGSGYIGSHCRNWFIGLDREAAHYIFYESLKSRKPSDFQFDLIKRTPEELKMVLLGRDLSKKHCELFSKRLGIFV